MCFIEYITLLTSIVEPMEYTLIYLSHQTTMKEELIICYKHTHNTHITQLLEQGISIYLYTRIDHS